MTSPSPNLTPLQARRAMNANILGGSMGVTFGTLVSGAALTGFALALKATDVEIGLIGSLGLLALPMQVVAAYVSARLRVRKGMWIASAVLYRLLWVLVLFLPVVMPEGSRLLRVYGLIGLLFLMALTDQWAQPVWFSWIADIVPPNEQARFWGRRSAWLNLVAIVALLGGSELVDLLVGQPPGNPKLYIPVFALGILFGVGDLLIHWWRIPEPPMAPPKEEPRFWRLLTRPFKEPLFRNLLVFNGTWNLAVWLVVPFFNVFFLKNLGLSFFEIAIFTCVNMVSAAMTSRFWGYLADKFGPKPIFDLTVWLKPLVTLGIVVTTTSNYAVVLTLFFLFDGIINAGMGVASLPLLLGLAPKEDRSSFVAVHSMCVGLMAAAGPILGGYFLSALEGTRFQLLLQFDNMKILFLLSTLARLGTVFLLPIVRDLRGVKTMHVLRQIVGTDPFRVVGYLDGLSKTPGEAARARVVKELGDAGSPLATGDLIRMLDDPSVEVREEAARALGKIGDEEAVAPLTERLRSPDSEIQDEAAWALGKIGMPESVQPLLETLPTAERDLKHSVLRALGDIGDRRAAASLLRLLESEKDSMTVRIVLETLSRIGEIQAIHAILPQLRSTTLPLVKHHLAIAMGNLLGREGEFYALLSRELSVPGEAMSDIADAVMKVLRGRYRTLIRSDEPEAVGEKGTYLAASRYYEAARDAYLSSEWGAAMKHLEICGMVLLGVLPTRDPLADLLAAEATKRDEYVQKIEGVSKRNPSLGADHWYLYVMTSAQYVGQHPVTMTEAMLAFYAFSFIFADALAVSPPGLPG